MTATVAPARYDLDAIKSRVPLPELCRKLGVELKRSGVNKWVGLCPFHSERSPSFTLGISARNQWHYHCYGCGSHGDVFSFYENRVGGDFKLAVEALAGMAGLGPESAGWTARPLAPAPAPAEVEATVWPTLKRLSDESCEFLALQRGLRPEGVMAARDAGLIFGCRVGVLDRPNKGERTRVYGDDAIQQNRQRLAEVCRCWVVSDGARKVMQFRRLDGRKWSAWNPTTRTREESFKSDTLGSTRWPQGARLIGRRSRVVLVEGGPDLLAAFNFLHFAGLLDQVAVVEAVSASVNFDPAALPYFERKRVRVLSHWDKLDQRSGKRAGDEAAAKWLTSLSAAGAEVDAWTPGPMEETGTRAALLGLWRANRYPHEPVEFAGCPAGDLNDCALGDAECVAAAIEAMNFQPTLRI